MIIARNDRNHYESALYLISVYGHDIAQAQGLSSAGMAVNSNGAILEMGDGV